MSNKKVQNNKRIEGMFTGIRNTVESSKNNIKNTTQNTSDMIKNINHLPWKKLPPFGWVCLISSLIIMILILLFIHPLVNI